MCKKLERWSYYQRKWKQKFFKTLCAPQSAIIEEFLTNEKIFMENLWKQKHTNKSKRVISIIARDLKKIKADVIVRIFNNVFFINKIV